MDRSVRVLRRIAAGLVLGVIAACGSPAPEEGPLPQAAAWVAPRADVGIALTSQPATCLAADTDLVRQGEVLFNSPLVLGGQAAKAGLSCASCHVNGRGNSDFVFEGISGAPGTADTTNALFGPARGDGIFNPVVIPDLATDAGRRMVNRDDRAALGTFLRSQIAEEFQGRAPSDHVVEALGAYLRALDDAACEGDAREPVTWRNHLRLARMAYASADIDAAYRPAARHALRLIHDRFPAHEDSGLRAALIAISRDMADGALAAETLAALDALEDTLEAAEPRSLYNEAEVQRRFGPR